MDNRKIEDLTNRIIKEEQTLLKDRMLFNWIALEVINFVEYQAIVKKLALCGVSQQRELLQKIESVKNFEWGINPVDNENRMCELIKLL